MLGWWVTNSAVVKLFRTRFQIPYVPTSQHRDQSKIGIASQMVLLIRNSSCPGTCFDWWNTQSGWRM